ncbi:MAG: Uma2 family endonuclease [Arcicella sp.]|nr:Uma2 family endonuclease [Arcicella sp.]
MTITVEKILARPDAQILVDRAAHLLLSEKQKRHSFREWLDEDKKAEFINGEIIMHSPVKKKHWAASGRLTFLLEYYILLNDLGTIAVEKALIALTRNDYEPDICFFSKETASSFTDDQMIFPAPDFVVEILSKSTAKKDKGIKHQDYAAHGIKEYWIIDPTHKTIDQYILIGDETEYLPAKTFTYFEDIKSYVIEGFEIPVAAIFDDKIKKETIQNLLDKNP